jgi:hypothetical protein
MLSLLIGFSWLEVESSGQLATAPREMPSNGDRGDSKQRRDRHDGLTLDFVHHDDSAATWRQIIEGLPHAGSDHIRGFGVIALSRTVQKQRAAPANRFLAPLIAPNVDEHADEPRFLFPQLGGDGVGRTRSPEEGLLHQIQGIVGDGNETTCKAVEPVDVRVEQSR